MSAVWRGCGTPHPIRKRVPTSLGAAPAGPGRGGGGSPAGTRTAALFARGTFSGPGGRGPRRGTRPQLQAGRGLMLEVSKTYERPGISIRRPVTAKVIFRKFDTCRCQMRDEPCIAQHVTARPHACHTSPRRTLKGGTHVKFTISLTDDAGRYLKAKLHGKRIGAGALLSALLLEQRGREESQRPTQAQETPLIRAPWEGPHFSRVRRHHER
jgi:hypothetical protein